MYTRIKEVSPEAIRLGLNPGQFVHLSQQFLDPYFYDRGIRLVGTIGCGRSSTGEFLVGNVSVGDAVLRDSFRFFKKEARLPSKAESKFIAHQKDVAQTRKTILLDYLGQPKIAYPLPNSGGGGEITRPADYYGMDSRAKADSVSIEYSGQGASFSPADCPIVSIVAIKGDDTRLGMFHFGYIPVYEGVGGVLRSFLSDLSSQQYTLWAFISAGAKTINVYGERAEKLLEVAKADETLTRCIRLHGDTVDIDLQYYAGLICTRYIGDLEIECATTDTISSPNLYSQRAGGRGLKPNGRNAQFLCLV